MKPSVKKSQVSKREEKKRINIRWNSALFFQVGLIVSLLLVFLVMETHWELPQDAAYDPSKTRVIEEPPMMEYQIEEKKPEVKKTVEPPKEKKPMVEKPQIIDDVKEVDDNASVKETKVASSEPSDDPVPSPSINEGKKTEAPGNKNILTVENAPIFPGCESLSSNEERRDCFNEKIRAFIHKSFRVEKFSDKYMGERNRVDVVFTVDAEGNIVNVVTRAPHEDLGEEAKRVIAKLPKMTPAKHNNTYVDVLYAVPIILNIE